MDKPGQFDDGTSEIIAAAIEVHSQLGPGLLESIYETCLEIELKDRAMNCATQVALPVTYKGSNTGVPLRIDMLVADRVIVEIKAVEKVLPIHQAQLLTYMKLSGKGVGLLLNFNVEHMREGICRMVL